MAERYSKLFTLKTDLYTLGSPIIVKAGALLKDNETGNIIAQLKFKNIQNKVVKLIKVSIKSFDSLGRPLGENIEYQYLDLSESRNNEFGSKNAIFLPDGFARSFSVNVTEVGFDDNTLWQGWANAVWESFPVLESIAGKYDSETLKQIQLNYGNSCQYIPAKERGVWFCSCGAVNIGSEENCHKCNCSADALLSIDYEKMTTDAKERLECERKDAIYNAAINSAKQHPMDRLNTEGLEKAIEQLNSIIDWKDSKEKTEEYTKQIEEIKAQQEANKIAAAKKSKKNKIIAAVTIPSIIAVIAFVIVLFKVIIPNNQYNDAIALMDAGKYSEAISAFESMDGYKDSISKIEECNINIYGEEVWNKIKTVNVGDIYSFGSYEQDNNKSNGQEDIEWLVLAKEGTKILVISKYALDCQPYNTSYTDVTWETCTLRKWLNNNFINAAFSADEKAMIPTVTVSADNISDYSTNPGNATQDQVFLLSITEANKYFISSNSRQCKPTDCAVAHGAYVNSFNGNCWWWLRSPGAGQAFADIVNYLGNVDENGRYVNDDSNAVRPAMWIEIG